MFYDASKKGLHHEDNNVKNAGFDVDEVEEMIASQRMKTIEGIEKRMKLEQKENEEKMRKMEQKVEEVFQALLKRGEHYIEVAPHTENMNNIELESANKDEELLAII